MKTYALTVEWTDTTAVGHARIRNAEVRGYGAERLGTDLAKSWNVFLA